MRWHYLITYDIADDKRRSQVFDMLSDNGDHTQFSVFLCQLSPEELARLSGRLKEALHEGEDQILVVNLGKAMYDIELEIEAIGRCFKAPIRTKIV
jgi:CRISPR-associated protein Cas2